MSERISSANGLRETAIFQLCSIDSTSGEKNKRARSLNNIIF